MKAKILIGSLIALAIASFGIAANADTYAVNNIPCSTVTYGAWGNCMNGIQTRDVIGLTPFYCALTANEQAGRSQICGQVLGVKIYGAGVLLRNPYGKIYAVKSDNTIQYVPDLASLQAYRGWVVYNVSDALIAQYQQGLGQVLGVKTYANGTLVRTPDMRAYVIVNGVAQYISSPSKLQAYKGRTIFSVSYDALNQYSQTSAQVLGVKIYANGSLLRSPDMKIFLVVSGQLQYVNSIQQLQLFSGRKIIDISWATLAQYQQVLPAGQVLGVKIYGNGTLLRTPDNKIYVITDGKPQYINSLEQLYQYRNTRIINVSYSVLASME
jgi:hypothetical protein